MRIRERERESVCVREREKQVKEGSGYKNTNKREINKKELFQYIKWALYESIREIKVKIQIHVCLLLSLSLTSIDIFDRKP